MKTGDVVWANFGDGDVLALYVDDAGEQADGTQKDLIQAPDGAHRKLAYREPGDRDDAGAGLTWWKI